MNSITKTAMERYGDVLFKGSLILFIAFTPISIALTEVAFWLIFIGYVTNKVGGEKSLLRITRVEIAFFAFVAAMVFTSFFSIKPRYSLASVGAFRFFLLYFMLNNYELKEGFVRLLVGVIILMAAAWSGCEIIKYFHTKSLRLNIFTSHVNTLVIPMLVGLLLMGQINRMKRGLLLLFLCIILLASFLSLSRAAWLGTSAGVIVVLYYWNWKMLLPAALLTVILVFFVALCCPHSSPGKIINSTVKPFQPGGERTGSNLARLTMLKDTVSILKKDLFTGIGPNAYRYVSTEGYIRISMDTIEILATSGLIGFTAYGWLLFTLLRRCLQNVKARGKKTPHNLHHILSICFLAALIGFLVCGNFEPNFFSTKRLRLMMLILGINECLLRVASKETNDGLSNNTHI